MRPELEAIAARNQGPFTRQDAVRCGYSERELKTLTGHRGGWVVLGRGVYVDRAIHDAAGPDGQYLLRVRGAGLRTQVGTTFSHASAAAILEMPLRPQWRDLVHTTRPDARGGRSEGGVVHHRGLLDESTIVVSGALRATGLARTGVDIARERGFEDGVVALDAARRLGATDDQVWTCLAPMAYWPGITSARAAARFSDGGAQNPGESLMRILLGELDLGPIETQFRVSDGFRTAFADARIGRHLFEFDGRVKYVGRERGGVADRPAEEVLWEEKQREDWIRRTQGGYGMSRFVWSDLLGTERRRTQERVRREFAETVRRFGWDG